MSKNPFGNIAIPDTMGQRALVYLRDAKTSRRMFDPPKDITRINAKRRMAISLFAAGQSHAEIAGLLDIPLQEVYAVLRTTEAQTILRTVFESVEAELKSLMPMAVDAIRRGLTLGDIKTQVQTAKLVLEANGKLKNESDPPRTAEDVVGEVIALAREAIARASPPMVIDMSTERSEEGLRALLPTHSTSANSHQAALPPLLALMEG